MLFQHIEQCLIEHEINTESAQFIKITIIGGGGGEGGVVEKMCFGIIEFSRSCDVSCLFNGCKVLEIKGFSLHKIFCPRSHEIRKLKWQK